MTGKAALKYMLPAPILFAPAGPAISAPAGNPNPVPGGDSLAHDLGMEVVGKLVTNEIMKSFGISTTSATAIDYDRIRAIIEDVVSDQNKKQTMGRLLGGMDGVNKIVADILQYARADKSATIDESTNDRQVRELINGLWTPLNTVLAELEGKYTGESHDLLEAYTTASHLKLSLAALRIVRARYDIAEFEKRLARTPAKNKKLVRKYKKAIKVRRQAANGDAGVYATQLATATKFIHALMFNDRAAMVKTYIKRNIDDGCAGILGATYLFLDRANYDPYDPAGGAKYPFGAVRYKLRNDAIKNHFRNSNKSESSAWKPR
jgi:hypothetical protein